MVTDRGWSTRDADPVVITGIGLVTPLGVDRETTWRRLLAGERSVGWLPDAARTAFEQVGFPHPWGGTAPLTAAQILPGRDRSLSLARVATAEALADASFDPADAETGCVFGASKGGLSATAAWWEAVHRQESHDLPPFPDLWPSAAGVDLAEHWNLRGPLLTPVAACATGLAACLRGVNLLQEGTCEVVLAGSVDAAVTPAVLASFRRLGVLAPPEPDPAAACRPFDRQRQGFAVGEGAACLVLERQSHALRRGARWYCAWDYGRLAADPTGLTQLAPDGAPLQRLIRDVLRGQRPDLLHLHGTGTHLNDAVESQAVAAVLGDALPKIPAVSVKGALGHLLGAAGSVELALAALSLRDQIVPPVTNLVHSDPACPLPWLPRTAERLPIERVLKLSLGFGGHLAAAVLRRCRGDGEREALSVER